MGKERMEMFSDGVIAILITVMVLELKAPAGEALKDLTAVGPTFLSYVLSFVYLAIYWNNHHHMLRVARTITGGIMWANTHLLFWLSLIPFTTSWMGEHPTAAAPTAVYGANLILCGCAYSILATLLARHEGRESPLTRALGRDLKGKLSLVAYAIGIAAAWVQPLVSIAVYAGVACTWLVPDRRMERAVRDEGEA
ncbi:MAG: DUF1211 domain-containing protein [Proteobacteria bacterium]|nr:DUF1211 domain-containing protein [Pseudomonadota bacterium]